MRLSSLRRLDTLLASTLSLLFAYVVGSIPTGVWLGRITHGIDVRGRGSGSSGGTNVGRVLGWTAGTAVIALDAFKGYAAVSGAAWIAGSPGDAHEPEAIVAAAGLCATIGHVWPCLARFRGGKGAATSLGALVAIAPWAAALAAAIFVVLLAIWRIVSIASVGAAAGLCLVLTFLSWSGQQEVPPPLLALAAFLALIIAIAHRTNFRRLLEGREPRLGKRRTPPGS